MVKVRFFPDNKFVHVEKGTTILKAARLAGVLIESPCDGALICGKCKVKLDANSLKNVIQRGKHDLSPDEELQGYVLSCQTEVIDDISVELKSGENGFDLKILDQGSSFDVQIDSLVKKTFDESLKVTKIYVGSNFLGAEDGNTEEQNYGIAIDIGTTTVVVSLINVNTGEEVASTSALNPQAIYAQDVLSRIKFASEEDGLRVMYTEIIKKINKMIDEINKSSGVKKENIYEAIFSGNTCMLHLAAGVDPHNLGKYPYNPAIWGGTYLKAVEHKLDIAQFGLIYFPPIISAYVGADITSGILACQLYNKKGTTLFVDIGTNGEMVIGRNGRLSATSTAAGPAFEGMNITYGMRAGNGAIERFNVEKDGNIGIKTVGGFEPVGICGSGLLDILGELVVHGLVNKNGKLINSEKENILLALRERLFSKDGKPVFRLADNVYLSQKDIRQVQLAKGAVRAGIEFLLRNKGVYASEVNEVLIAGSFGYHLRAESLINIGLLPEEFAGKINFVGNTSKSGGKAFLLNQSYKKLMEKVVKDIEVIELANYQDFDKIFVKCLGF